MYHILIAEDDPSIAELMSMNFAVAGFRPVIASDGKKALECIEKEAFDLAVFDIMLPELNGLEVLRRLRAEKQTPVILLTARDSVMDKVSGLDAGAIDYITKPFAIEELLARIRVALKFRSVPLQAAQGAEKEAAGAAKAPKGALCWGRLVLDDKSRRVTWDGRDIDLTNREFLMLRILLENRDIVLSRDTLLDRVCGYDYIGETNIVDVYVRHLRSKIDEVYGVRMIQTVRGAGYVIRGDQ